MRTKWLARSVGVLALVAAGAACSSSSKSGTSNTSSSTGGSTQASSSPATGSPVKVGAICSCSGALGPSTVAMGDTLQAWAKSVNASGGVNGHPIDLTFLDDASSPGTSVTEAQRLISNHVAAIVDISLFDSTWANAAVAAKIPVVGVTQSAPVGTNPDFFPATQTFGSVFYGEATLAKQAGAKNLGILVCAEAVTCQQEAPLLKAAGNKLGVPLIYTAAVSASAPNYTAQCLAAQQAKTQALFVALAATTGANVAADCDRQGYEPTYVADNATYLPSMVKAPIGKNYWVDFTNLPDFADTAATHTMSAAVDRYYPGLRSGGDWTGESANGWIAGLLIRDAVKGAGVPASGTFSAAQLAQGLYSLKGDTLDGWSSPLNFAAGQPHPVNCWFSVKIVNGTQTVLNNGQPTCEQ